MLPSCKPYYAACPSTCPSLVAAANLKTKRCRKTKENDVNVSHVACNRCAEFLSVKRSKVYVSVAHL